MTETTPTYRCNAPDFVSDLLDFARDQISRAMHDPLDQFAATDAASGVVWMIRERLLEPENHVLLGQLLLALNGYIDKSWEEPWGKLAKMPPEKFAAEAAMVLKGIDTAKTLCEAIVAT
jgi:hypothetical protein